MVINKQEIIAECFSVEQDKSHSRQKHHYHHNTFPDFKKIPKNISWQKRQFAKTMSLSYFAER